MGLDSNFVAEIRARAQVRWPEMRVASEDVSAAVERAAASGLAENEIHGEDLCLSLSCLRGDRNAVEILEREILANIRPAVERSGCRREDVDDVLQLTLEKLLLGPPPSSPKLASYTGRGPLVAWVRVVAVRVGLEGIRKSLRDRAADRADDAALLGGASTAASIELSMLKQMHGASFRVAVQEALRRLGPEQRALLRFHAKDGLTIDQIAPMLGIHRATAARRLTSVRTRALELVREVLHEKHGLSESEAMSLCLALANEVDVSIGRALADEGAG